jgi:hypothetical protein
MERATPLLRRAGLLLVATAAFFVCVAAQGKEGQAPAPGRTPAPPRTDRIIIDTLAAHGKLELPPVAYFHDKHTEALAKEKKDCSACHLTENGRMSFTYRRTSATPPDKIQAIYHEGCIGCHMEMAAAGKKTGPLDGFCRSCHNAAPPPAQPLEAGLDKVLHYRHVASPDISAPRDKDNCGVCHHQADPQTGRLTYVKGKEDGCRTCHGEKAAGRVPSLKTASHEQCVRCHLELGAKGVKKNGPYESCADCHSAGGRVVIARNNQSFLDKLPDRQVPRLLRGQPDAALLTWLEKKAPAQAPARMNPVPFDHQAHEAYADSCRSCHHTGISSCTGCHTLLGDQAGGGVTYEQAMHAPASTRSCIGCHTARTRQPDCAGCHATMARKDTPDGCRFCHQPLPKGTLPLNELASLTPQQRTAVAEIMLKSRPAAPAPLPAGQLPGTVILRELSSQYEPVAFDHADHLNKLEQAVKGSKLAQYFHGEALTLCQGCHHNSPASMAPPRCSSCHARAFDPRQPARPGLQAAYHGQCMSCHREMQVKLAATSCQECHAPKKK